MGGRQAVLVVDDDRVALGSVVSCLNAAGFDVTGAGSGAEGLEFLRQHLPALVLADIHLPDMAGVDFLSGIRRTTDRVPVLFFAGPDEGRDLAAVVDAGAAGFILKPVGDMALLRHGVRQALEHARLFAECERLRAEVAAREQSHAEQLKLQERLFQAEKETAVGRLASSISHDFNNVLTVMSGFAQCLMATASPDTIIHDYAERIENAADRAGDLVRQLSEFGRSRTSVQVSTDLNRIVGEVAQLLSRTIDKRITFHAVSSARKPWVLADPTRLQLALLNLGASAGNAMPVGGNLTYETRDIHVDSVPDAADIKALPPGDYLEVAIRDTGGTMDENAARKTLQPLCNGKPLGYATELGLSGVQNCVREHRGQLSFQTRPGEHRAIILRLPVADVDGPADGSAGGPETPRASGHILLADDEEMIRTFVEQSLTGMGYNVTACPDGAAAVEFYARHAGSIDLVILDQNMPGLSGPDAFKKIREINPAASVLLCTGLDDTEAARRFTEAGGAGVLSKPFRLAQLSGTVARAIAAAK
ncbi:MAG: response regulator [Tepidisphaerales bacterium]